LTAAAHRCEKPSAPRYEAFQIFHKLAFLRPTTVTIMHRNKAADAQVQVRDTAWWLGWMADFAGLTSLTVHGSIVLEDSALDDLAGKPLASLDVPLTEHAVVRLGKLNLPLTRLRTHCLTERGAEALAKLTALRELELFEQPLVRLILSWQAPPSEPLQARWRHSL
jgi:hypothetical protein